MAFEKFVFVTDSGGKSLFKGMAVGDVRTFHDRKNVTNFKKALRLWISKNPGFEFSWARNGTTIKVRRDK